MKKIPTLFIRDLTTGKVIDEVHPDCTWVGDPDVKQFASRKWDGTCVKIKRRDFKIPWGGGR